MAYGEPPRCACGQYHMVETSSAVVRVPCPFGWDEARYTAPLVPVMTEHHCPGCSCERAKENADG